MGRSLFGKRYRGRDHDEPMRLTRRDTDSIYGTMHDAQRMLSRDPETSSGETHPLFATGETFLAAVGVGALSARLGTANIPGTSIPLAPVVGIVGHVAAVFHREIGIPKKAVEHMHNVSNGLIAGWGALWGMGIGAGMRERAGLAPTDVRVGGLPGMPASTIGCGPAGCMQNASMQSAPMLAPPTPGVKPLSEVELAALYRRQ
jgi:hypothetical protein